MRGRPRAGSPGAGSPGAAALSPSQMFKCSAPTLMSLRRTTNTLLPAASKFIGRSAPASTEAAPAAAAAAAAAPAAGAAASPLAPLASGAGAGAAAGSGAAGRMQRNPDVAVECRQTNASRVGRRPRGLARQGAPTGASTATATAGHGRSPTGAPLSPQNTRFRQFHEAVSLPPWEARRSPHLADRLPLLPLPRRRCCCWQRSAAAWAAR